MPTESAEPSARQRLLDSAVHLFTERGYAATSVREIVESAGLTKPALYYHFRSKEGIYLAILHDLARTADEGIAARRVESGPVRDRIERFLLGIFDLFEQNRTHVRFVNAVFWGPRQGAPPFDFDTFHQKLLTVLGQIVVEGIASGELRAADPEDATLALMGVLSFSMDYSLAHPELGLGRDGLRRAIDLLFAGLAAPDSTRKETAR
jgi:AcrR family transcriptional regulator